MTRSQVDPSEFASFLKAIEDLMRKAHLMGLMRTQKRLHKAVLTARGEIPEAMALELPEPVVLVGPVRKQSL